jgi:hypothetical protein
MHDAVGSDGSHGASQIMSEAINTIALGLKRTR